MKVIIEDEVLSNILFRLSQLEMIVYSGVNIKEGAKAHASKDKNQIESLRLLIKENIQSLPEWFTSKDIYKFFNSTNTRTIGKYLKYLCDDGFVLSKKLPGNRVAYKVSQ